MKNWMALLSLVLMTAGPLSYAGQNVTSPKTAGFTIVDENQKPVANATIMLGYDKGNPFPNNTLTTDSSGVASLPAAWKDALPVTVQAPGYVAATIPTVAPTGSIKIQLSRQEPPNEIEIKGTATGFGNMVDDGKVQFGLVVPAMSKSQMLSFDMSTVISPQTDAINVIGQTLNLPSNITLPDQTVTYIFPIELNKPDYRSYVRSPGQYVMSAVHGNFPMQKVINEYRAGKSIFDMVNDFTFVEGGQTPVSVNGDVSGIDIAVNQTPFNGSVSVTAPQVASNQVVVSLVLNDQNGLFFPSDLKRLTPGQAMSLKSSSPAPSVLSLLLIDSNAKAAVGAVSEAVQQLLPLNLQQPRLPHVNKNPQDFNHMSFALQPATGGVTPQFLPMIDAPAFDPNSYVMTFATPTLPAGMTAVATYAVLSEIQTFSVNNGVQSEQRTRLWEVWSPTWLQKVQLPKFTFTRNANRTYRWDVMFLARPANVPGSSTTVNGVDLQSVTHATRNILAI